MGLFSKVAGSSEARSTHRAAKAELKRVSERDRSETDDYLAANDAVVKAEADLPAWRRL